MKISILGTGTWGVALANAFIVKHEITMWSRFDNEIQALKETHRHKNLPGAIIDERIVFTNSLEDACLDAEMIILAVPSIAVRQTTEDIKNLVNKNQIIIDVAKGIEEDTLFTMSEVIKDVLGADFNVVALSGPTHAEEVSIGLPTCIVAACNNIAIAKKVQEELSLPYFRIYANEDVRGVEYSAALKNVIALAAGASEGLGYGDNAKAAIITRGLAEIVRLGKALGCKETTYFGLAGIGDIVVTATSNHSRNHNAGVLLGKGYSLEETLKQVGMVVEGINCLKAAKKLSSKVNVELPIVNAVYSIIFEDVKPIDAVNKLFARDLKTE